MTQCSYTAAQQHRLRKAANVHLTLWQLELLSTELQVYFVYAVW